MNRLGGLKQETGPIRLHVAKVKVPLSTVIAAWAGRRLFALVRWLVVRPLLVLALILAVLTWRAATELPALISGSAAASIPLGLVAWWRLRPESFTRLVVWRLRGLWRGARVYRYCWQPAMVTTGLAVRVDGVEYLPKMTAVRSSSTVDLVSVQLLPGQTVEDWVSVAGRLAQTFGASDARVRSVPSSPREVVLWFLVDDPLTDTVDRFAPAEDVDLGAVPVARREDGLTYRLRLLGTHLLVVGVTGAGKGSVLWSLLAGLAPAIRDRLVQVWAIDPKGGMELAPGRALFTRFTYGDPVDGASFEDDFASMLEDAVAVMRRRQATLRGVARLHTPSVAEPLIVLVVDEMASLTAYVQDRDAKRRIAAALSLLLSQGRAVGVSVVGALQDPRKDVLPFRDLFPTRIALRLSEADQVGLVLGSGARDRGARCDQIPESLPGVGYVGVDGVAEPVRVRFTHVTDADIADLVARYTPVSTTVPTIAAVAA